MDFQWWNVSYVPLFLFGLLVGVPSLLSLVFKIHIKPCHKNSQLMIIRHAEKPEKGDWLSRDGKCRAKKLSSCFDGDNLKIPDMLFTYMPTSDRSSMRGLTTLLPMSKELNIPMYPYRTVDYIKMLEDIETRICGQTSLLAWHHNFPGVKEIVL